MIVEGKAGRDQVRTTHSGSPCLFLYQKMKAIAFRIVGKKEISWLSTCINHNRFLEGIMGKCQEGMRDGLNSNSNVSLGS